MLSYRLSTINRAQSSVQYDIDKRLNVAKKLQTSINQPVSHGIVQSDRYVVRETPDDIRSRGPRAGSRSMQPLESLAVDPIARNRRPRSVMELKRALKYEPLNKTESDKPKKGTKVSAGPIIMYIDSEWIIFSPAIYQGK